MFNSDPFLEPANPRWPAIVTDAFIELLSVRGLHEFSMAAVARWMRASTAAVAQRAPRQESLRMIVVRVAARYHWWSVRPAHWIVEPRLPSSEAERRGVRAWALVGELARGDSEAEAQLAARRAAERADVEEWWRAHRTRGGEGAAGEDELGGEVSAGDESGGVKRPACERDGGGTFEEYFAVLTGLRLVLAFGLTSLSAREAQAVLERLVPRPGAPDRQRARPSAGRGDDSCGRACGEAGRSSLSDG